jgi:hypothetical protein
MGIINMGLELLAITINMIALRRYLNKKKMALMEERQNGEGGIKVTG